MTSHDHSISDHNVNVVIFETANEPEGFDMHELLCKAIHEQNQEALDVLSSVVTDIMLP